MTVEAKDIIEILRDFSKDEESYYYDNAASDYWHWGTTRIRGPRVAEIAALAAINFPGNITEIGAERGLTTIHLVKVAERYHRKMIVVDPWDVTAPACFPGYYEEFMGRMTQYMHLLEVVRMDSRSKEAKGILGQPLSFAFVDGLHTYEACKSDILATYHAGIICVDDVQNNWKMMRAFTEGAEGRRMIAHPWCKEKYIL